jgi:hypothetical protein
VLAAETSTSRPDVRIYWVDPGDMRTEMHQRAFPGEDISDRALPAERVPAFIRILEDDLPSGRYEAKALNGRSIALEREAVLAVGGGER